MNKNIYLNLFLVLIILLIIRYTSPAPDSVLYILKKYINFIIYKIKSIFSNSENFTEGGFNGNTFQGLPNFNLKAPDFISYNQRTFMENMIKKNPALNIDILKILYAFITNLVSLDTNDYFLTGSDTKLNTFTTQEIETLKNILLIKLNKGQFKFTNLIISNPITYYNNNSGREINPFYFKVFCNENIGNLNIFINIDIRNDVIINQSYVVIKKIRPSADEDYDNNKIVNFDINTDVTNQINYESSNNNSNNNSSSNNNSNNNSSSDKISYETSTNNGAPNTINYETSNNTFIENSDLNYFLPNTENSKLKDNLRSNNILTKNSSNPELYTIQTPILNFSKEFIKPSSQNVSPNNLYDELDTYTI
jgi:hypothetical protein